MMRIVRGVMRALRPRNLLAALGVIVLTHVVVDQVLLVQAREVEEEIRNKAPIKNTTGLYSSNNAAPLYLQAYWLNGQTDREVKEKYPQIKCPQASFYSLALDGFPCGAKQSTPLSPEELELYGEVIAAKQPVYDLIAKATERPECEFNTSYAPELWNSANYEGSTTLREMMRLLSDKARWNVRHGEVQGAWESVRQLLVCVKRAGGNGAISGRLMQKSLFRIAASTIFDVADQGPVPDSVTAAYFAPFRAITDTRMALEAARFETAMYVQNIDLQMCLSAWGAWIRPLASLGKLRTHEFYLQLQQALSQKTPMERMAAVKQVAEAEPVPTFFGVRLICPWRSMTTNPFPTFWHVYDLPDELLISCRMIETGIALKQYKQRQGSYPQDLDTLAKDLPADTTIDPVTGKPFEYLMEGDGFILKSPGPKALYGDKPGPFPPRDIVWQAKN